MRTIDGVVAAVELERCVADVHDRVAVVFHQRDLPNGMRVIVIPTDYPDIVTLQIPMQVGSRNEVEEGRTGFSHFFEHMMGSCGTPNFTCEEYEQVMRDSGADTSASATL